MPAMHAVNSPGAEIKVSPGGRTRTLRVAIIFGLLGLLLAGCLFGATPAARTSRWLGPILLEVLAMFRDPGTQWMVFACCGVYFTTFVLLQHRESGKRFWRWNNPDVWLIAALGLAASRYALGYGAQTGTEMLVWLGGATLGKCMAWASFKSRKRKAESRELKAEDGGRASALFRDAATTPEGKLDSDRKMDFSVTQFPVIVQVLLGLLVVAVFWQNEAGMRFQYREQARWTGPWENPNVFGMLMGVGMVLALGRVVSSSCKEPVVRGSRSVVASWLKLSFFLTAAGILGFGLVMSYSRGAWVGTAAGTVWLAWGRLSREMRGIRDRENQKFKVQSARSAVRARSRDRWGGRLGGFLGRNAVPLAVLAVSLVVLAFWQFRHTEVTTVRRAFSVGNVNDFSWRNRVAAWVGALQMMAERPLTGWGWNQVEPIYDQFYRPSHVYEGMAIQLNDYLTLGVAIGIPALACLLACVGLSLGARGEGRRTKSEGGGPKAENGQGAVRTENTAPKGRIPEGRNIEHPILNFEPRTATGQGASSDFGLRTSAFRSACHSGALVLLVAFWFDGGLFRLATATVFWLLLEMGRERCGDES